MKQQANPTFMTAAYDSFSRLLDVCLEFHIQRHRELIGSSYSGGLLVGTETEATPKELITKYYVEGLHVMSLHINFATGNRIIRTTDGHQWYSDDINKRSGQAA